MNDIKNPFQKRAVVLSDLSCFGKCSLTVAVPILSAMQIEAVVLPTSVLSTHTGEFENYVQFDMSEQMEKIFDSWDTLNLTFDAIYTGYFCSLEQLDFAKKFIKRFKKDNTLLLVDPVMADNGKFYDGFGMEYAEKMLSLCAEADVITPNITEAAIMCGLKENPENNDEIVKCINRLLKNGSKNVIITGVVKDDYIGYAFTDGDNGVREIYNKRKNRIMHGCGDVFASVLCGLLLKGYCFADAVSKSVDFTTKCIETTAEGLPYHWYGLRFEEQLNKEKF